MESPTKVNIKLGEHKISFEIPPRWSVNKLKCLLSTEIPKIEFNKFELKYEE